MKLPFVKAVLYLGSLTGSQLQSMPISEKTITFMVGAESNLNTPNVSFNPLGVSLANGDSYWSPSANWTFDSTDTAGYTVAITNNTGAGILHWTMTSLENKTLDFILITDRTITDTAAPSITASAGTNNNTINNLGGRRITPNTTPNPSENILYQKGIEDSGNKTYVIYAAIAGSQLNPSLSGTYTKTLTIGLTENS